MRDGFIGIAWLLFGLMPVTNALAQITVGPANRVNPNGTQWFECTVAGHLAFNGNRVVVAAIEHSVGGPFLNACYSTNGGVNWTTVSGLGPGATADPGLVLDRSSDTIWYSGIATALGQCSVRVAHKGASDSTFLGAYAATSGTDSCDKPLMAIGDGPNNGVLFYIFHADQDPDSNDPDDGHWYAYSANTDSPQVEQLWNHVRVEPQPLPPAQPPWNGPDYYGQGAMGVVLDSESAAPGRVVVIDRDLYSVYNLGIPFVVYSDDGGVTWLPLPDISAPTLPRVVNVGQPGTTFIKPFQPSDYPFGIDRHTCMPAIAVDRAPTPDDHVYAAFHARAERNDTTSGDRNVDIYICRSVDGGLTFPNLPEHIFQLTDARLGITAPDPIAQPGPDQVMPAIAIDNCGGVNLIFYDNRHDPNLADSDHRYAVYYVRITNFGPSATIYQKCLTVDNSTPPQPLPFRVPAPGDVPTFLGDYHHLAVAGANRLYAAYTARKEEQPGSGTWKQNCYLNRIVCTNFGFGDFNGNGLGDPDDITLFYEAYIAADSAADGTADCVVDVADESLFWTEFAELGD